MPATILVTGGTGLVGKAIEHAVRSDPEAVGETWFFAGSRDADLRLDLPIALFYSYQNFLFAEIANRLSHYLIAFGQLT